MHWVDVSILVIIAISALISLFRGFTREVLSLASWVVAIWAGLNFSHIVEPLLQPHIDALTPRLVVAFAIVFFGTLVVAALVNYLIVKLIQQTGLGGTDRAVGMLFGVARGVAIVAVLVLLGGLTPMPRDGWWQQSVLLVHFEQLVLWGTQYLPPELAQNVKFSYPPTLPLDPALQPQLDLPLSLPAPPTAPAAPSPSQLPTSPTPIPSVPSAG